MCRIFSTAIIGTGKNEGMPELPEVETARRLIADEALHRRIADVDDSDTFVCRPHSPGELRAALTGRMLTAARRRGKAMWCETSEERARPRHPPGHGRPDRRHVPGRSGRRGRRALPPRRAAAQGRVGQVHAELRRRRQPRPVRQAPARARPAQPRHRRARPGRRRGHPGGVPRPDHQGVGRGQGPAARPVQDRRRGEPAGRRDPLAGQGVTGARTNSLRREDADRLYRALESALRSAIARGGVHTGDVIAARHPGGTCPRCGAEMRHGTVGGRSTWWCSREQVPAEGQAPATVRYKDL